MSFTKNKHVVPVKTLPGIGGCRSELNPIEVPVTFSVNGIDASCGSKFTISYTTEVDGYSTGTASFEFEWDGVGDVIEKAEVALQGLV